MENMKIEKVVRGRDLIAPAQSVTLDGKTYTLKWGNRQARYTEMVYEEQYGRDAEYMEILSELQRQKHRAIEACVYGALRAGGCDMDFETFDDLFTYDSIDQLRDVIQKSVISTLPDPEQLGN